MKKAILMAAALFASVAAMAGVSAKKTTPARVTSPNGRISVVVDNSKGIVYSVEMDGKVLVAPSEISMTLADGKVYGGTARFRKKVSASHNGETIKTVVYNKAEVQNDYSEVSLLYDDFRVEFRAYDDGVAYRFVSASKTPFEVVSEQATFAFPEDWTSYIPYVHQNDETMEGQFHNSFENKYKHEPISKFDAKHYAFLPVLVEAADGVKLCITESDLRHYPGLYLYNGNASTTLTGVNAPYPKSREGEPSHGISMYVKGTENYIARYTAEEVKAWGGVEFPWRVIGISTDDSQLLANDMVYRLAAPQDPAQDFSWVKPGKVAWDWWNDWNLYGVDFKAGINTDTYKYYIDFAAKAGVEYVILDEGWATPKVADLMQVIPEIDLKEIIRHGEEKGVGIILWAGFYPFQKDVEGICRHYAEMGVKGFKVDFFDSDDQQIPEFLEYAASVAAKYHLMLDYHGVFKPTGLCRKWPNVVNYEGIYGLENMKWNANVDQVDYDVTVPFVRFFAGPADYTQGAMRNGSYGNVRSSNSEGMSPGTRCHQLGEYIVFFSPLNMLCDSPSNYLNEEECTQFIASVPTTWDDTHPLPSRVGEYACVARRSGDDWYVGGINNWTERDMTFDLSFLPEGQYKVTLFRDGVNAHRAGRDYKKESSVLGNDRLLKIHMAPGGGFAAKLERVK